MVKEWNCFSNKLVKPLGKVFRIIKADELVNIQLAYKKDIDYE